MHERSIVDRVLCRARRVVGRILGTLARPGPSLTVSVPDTFPRSDQARYVRESGVTFTVIIPTLNRADTLGDTIRTCLAQDDEDLRIIVSDDASIDNTAEVVASFSDSRLTYINPGRRLGMAEHWEFAIAHVDDGYVTVLGDDDGLLPGAVLAARQIIAKYDTKALAWQKIEYNWPDHIIPGFRNWLQIPLSVDVSTLKSLDIVKDVVGFRRGYPNLPCIYNAFISIDLVRSHRSRNGGVFFGGSNPDVYSAFAIASEVEEFVYCHRPLSINGASSKSNGTLQTVGDKNDKLAKSFWTDTKFSFEPGIPNVPIVEFCIIDSFLKVQKVTGHFSPDMIDSEMLIRSAVGATFGGYVPQSRHADRLEALKQYAASRNLQVLFDDLCERGSRSTPTPALSKPGYHPPHSIVFDASMLGVENVHSASLRAAEILDLKAERADLFDQLVKTRYPDLAVALFARAKGGPLRLHLGCGAAYFEGYVNVDFPQSQHAVMTVKPDVVCDLTEIDLPDHTVEEVRLQHVFEHLNRAVALASLITWHRWLRVGGKLHIETPDFEASARDFLGANSIGEKMRAIRHLEGDQVDGWAYHVGQWFPERFERTFKRLGFNEVDIRQEISGHTPPLHNVVAIGTKTTARTAEDQYEAGCELLKDVMVAEDERSTWEAWKTQLAEILAGEISPAPSVLHPPS